MKPKSAKIGGPMRGRRASPRGEPSAGWTSGDVVAEAALPFLPFPPREEPARSPTRPHAMATGTPFVVPDDGRIDEGWEWIWEQTF